MTRREETPPFGLIVFPKLIESSYPFCVRAFPFDKLRVLCPLLTSAYLTRDVAIQSAAGLIMRRCLFRGSSPGLVSADSKRTRRVLGPPDEPFPELTHESSAA